MTDDMFTDSFLDAMGAWQRGWQEQTHRRLELTATLQAAIQEIELPNAARTADEICYRKRFLYKDNSENGGDHVPIFLGGSYEEGVASWTIDFDYAKKHKREFREDANTAIFAHKPQPQELILNIKALWQIPAFPAVVDDYKSRGGVEAEALLNFKHKQSEVILNAPLRLEEIESFCAPIGSFDQLFELAGITDEQQQEEFVQRLKETDQLPGGARWLPRDASQRVVCNTLDKLSRKIESLKAG